LKKITAIGEILFDIYPDKKIPGGAPLNFLYHIHKITGFGNIVSRISNDELGENVLKFLDNNKINKSFIQKDALHPTGTATVKIDGNNQPSFIIDNERAYDYIELTNELERLVDKQTECFYFGTLAQRNDESRKTIQLLFNKRVKYFHDLNIRDNFYNRESIELSLKTTDVLKVNFYELKMLNELFLKRPFEINTTARSMLEIFEISLLAVTLGSDGSALFRNNETDYFKPDTVNVIDTVGAGDAFASVLCIGYLQNWSLKKINRLANDFAAEICKIQGAIPSDDGIYNLLKEKIRNEH
jgi:fructokinase